MEVRHQEGTLAPAVLCQVALSLLWVWGHHWLGPHQGITGSEGGMSCDFHAQEIHLG